MSERRAPVQRFGSQPAGTAPWSVHERAWAEYAKHYGTSQGAERIAERHGFCYDELRCLLTGHRPTRGCAQTHAVVEGWEPLA